MHSRHQLRETDFVITGHHTGTGPLRIGAATGRVLVVAPDANADLAFAAPIILALTHAFYARPAAQADGFFDYPPHFVVGGDAAASAPRLLGPCHRRPWSDAWCWLDVWPTTHHAVAAPSPDAMLQAALMLEPAVLLWPRRLPYPAPGTTPDELDALPLLRARLREVLLYGPAQNGHGDWTIALRDGALRLAQEAQARLPDTPAGRNAGIAPATYRAVDRDDFLRSASSPGGVRA
jgi:hypothetical protein